MMKHQKLKSKICSSCGREFEFRKKWEKNWEHVKFCSDECRKNKNKFDYSARILDLLHLKGKGETICPSEVLESDQRQDKALLEHVRRSARQLAHNGIITILQKGIVVDPNSFKGPIRLKLR
jgi:hypothetical protein